MPRPYGAVKQRVLQEHRERSARGVEQFVVRTGVIPEGHERLAREAAAGIAGITAADMRTLIDGVRRPDTESLRNHVLPGQQRRHALRATLCQPMAAALRDARGHLAALHARALAAPSRQEAFRWIGEALHLIQDSYAPAHVQRATSPDGRHPIVYIRFFGPTSRGMPVEHGFPFDPRDLVAAITGGLKPWSLVAIAASREYLRLMLRALATPRASRNLDDLRTFMDRHLFLSANRREPRQVYLRCRAMGAAELGRSELYAPMPRRGGGRPERNALLLHGTTVRRAQVIQNTGRFTPQVTYFAMGPSNRLVARVFALRAASRYPNEGGPALVLVSVPEAPLQRLRSQGLLRSDRLETPAETQGRLQWILQPGGVELLNQAIADLRIVRMSPSRPPRPRVPR